MYNVFLKRAGHPSKNATSKLQKLAPQRYIINNEAIQTFLGTFFSYI
jgi:hypothetical protein